MTEIRIKGIYIYMQFMSLGQQEIKIDLLCSCMLLVILCMIHIQTSNAGLFFLFLDVLQMPLILTLKTI